MVFLRKLGALHKAEARLHAPLKAHRVEEFYAKASEWGISPDAATYKRLAAVELDSGSLEMALETHKPS